MKRKIVFVFLAIVFIVIALVFLFQKTILKLSLERVINSNIQNPIQKGSVKFGQVWIDSKFRIHFTDLRMTLLTEKGNIPLDIGAVESRRSIANIFLTQGMPFHAERIKFHGSAYNGLHGDGVVYAGRKWFFKFSSEIDSVGLEEIDWINLDNLGGSKGLVTGTISFEMNWTGKIKFELSIHSQKPGGQVRAKLFSALLPYLPAGAERIKLQSLSGQADLVRYQEADLEARMVGENKMKILFHIVIPEYNLVLNLNVDVHVDKENAFNDIAKVLGWLKIKPR